MQHIIFFGNLASGSPPSVIGSAHIFHNGDVMAFLEANGFPGQYNDGLRAYFRTLYTTGGDTFQDLLARYIKEHGFIIPPGA